MNRSWVGTVITGIIIVGIGGFLFLNLESPRKPTGTSNAPSTGSTDKPEPVVGNDAPVREFPIGDEFEKNHIRVAAVWLPAVTMGNMPPDPNLHLIHIEADVKALADNPNGFAKDEKVDYLKIAYSVVPAAGGAPLATGELTPMMARDGFHYGANIAMPEPGNYRVVYDIEPPSMGRHSDPATGVAPWWEPFQASFDWTIDRDAVTTASMTAR